MDKPTIEANENMKFATLVSIDKKLSKLIALQEEKQIYEKPILTHAEAAKVLNIAERTLYGYANNGDISYHKAGKHNWYKLTDLLDYLANDDNYNPSVLSLKNLGESRSSFIRKP